MKEILLASIVFLTLTGLLGLFGVPVIAQETNLDTDTNNMTGTDTDTNNDTDTDTNNDTESEAGMISRRTD